MYDYQENNIFFAQVAGKSEQLCAGELESLGATEIKLEYRGIHFKADKKSLYRINYQSRIASRILAPIRKIKAYDTDSIYKSASKIKWEEFFKVDDTFSINATINRSNINNSLYAGQVLKDGIVDYFRKLYDRRPSVDTKNPDIKINLHIDGPDGFLSIDTSGESLHKRGYRLSAGEAPMQETVAAAIIRSSGWNGENHLWDPMCGSGTILCEALMHYCRIPAQYLRKKFGFFHLPDFEEKLWEEVKTEAESNIKELSEGLISGSDKSQKIIPLASENLERLPFGNRVHLSGQPFQHFPSFNNGTIITNPPYGIRLGERKEVEELYTELGDFIKTRCSGTTAWIYMGETSLRKHIGLRTSARVPLVNGKLEGVLVKIESYEGSKKAKYREEKGDNTP